MPSVLYMVSCFYIFWLINLRSQRQILALMGGYGVLTW